MKNRTARKYRDPQRRQPRATQVERLEVRELLFGTPLGQFVDAAYQDVLERPAEQSGLEYWTNRLGAGSIHRGDVARSILISGEHARATLNELYTDILGRPAEPAGLNYWATAIQTGTSELDIEAGFLGSAEYFQKNGASNASFIAAAYQDILGRTAGTNETAYWLDRLNVITRQQAARSLIYSPENLRQEVSDWYQTYLHRTPDDGGLNYWTNFLSTGTNPNTIQIGFIASTEYYERETAPAIRVPGASGTVETKVHWGGRTALQSEVGLFVVENDAGIVNGMAPSHPDYAQTILASATRQVIFTKSQAPTNTSVDPATLPGSTTLNLPAGALLGVYVIQNGSAADALPPTPRAERPPVYLSFPSGNGDGFDHYRYGNYAIVGIEDLTGGGDQDFDDAVLRFEFPEDISSPPVNRPPVVASIANQTIPEEAAFQLQVSATDPDGPASAIRFSLDAASVNRGIAIDPVTGLLTWTPHEAQGTGAYSVIVKATDGGSPAAIAERTFTINVSEVNRAPVLPDVQSRTVSSGTNVTFSAAAADPDLPANVLLYSLLNGPAGATIDAATGAFQWTPTPEQSGQTYTMTVRVSDQVSPALIDEATFTIEVEDCVFDADPTAWSSFEEGGSETGKGTTSIAEMAATLVEGDSFVVGIERTIAIPASPSQLRFSIFSQDFDESSTGAIRDAFEAALVDENGTPIVLPFASGRDAFFNLTEGVPAALGPNATFDGNTVVVDLSGVTVTSAKLIFRLVNNDADAASTISLTCVRVEPLATPLNAAPLTSPAQGAGNANNDSSSATKNNTPLVGPALPPGVMPRSTPTSTPAPSSANPPVFTPQDDPLPVDSFTIDNRGKDFWLGFADNLLEGGNQATKTLFITGDVATTGTVSVPGLAFEQAFAVNPGEVTAVVLPTLVEVESLFAIQDLGIHVVADEEVTVYGLNRAQSTTDAYLALPTDALGTEYINLTYENDGYFLAFIAGTQLLLVGAHDDTQVTISPGIYSIPTANSNVNWKGPANNTIFNISNGVDSSLFVVDTAGNHKLEVTPPTLGYAGTYQFRILDLASNSTPIALGATATGALATGQETVVYRFAGSAGQRVFIDGQNPAFAPNSTYRLLSPSGVFLSQANLESNTEILTLTESGDFYVLVSSAANVPVNFKFRVLDVADAAPIAFNTVIAGTMPADARRTDVFEFTGTIGQQVAFDGQSLGRGTDVVVYAPGGTVIASFVSADDRYPVTLPSTGTYVITVDGRIPGEAYSFRVLDLDDVTPVAFDAVVNAASVNNRELSIYSFEAVAGEKIQYDGLNGLPIDFQIFGPFGTQVFVGRTSSDSNALTLPVTGTYHLYVQGVATGPTAFPFRLIDLANAADYTLGATLTGDLAAFESKPYRFDVTAGMPLYYDGLDGDFDAVRTRVVTPNAELIGSFFNADSDSNFLYSSTVGDGYVFVSNEQGAAADFGLTLRDISTAPLLPLNTDVTANLPTGRETAVYRVDATVGDRLIFDGRVGTGSIPARLIGPNGQVIFQANTDANSPVTAIVDEGPHYLLILGGVNGASTAQFRMHDADASPALAFNVDTPVSFTPGNGLAAYAFNATAGQRVTFDNLSVATPGAGSWALIAPNNATVITRNIEVDLAANLPQTGQYLLVFSGNGTQASVQATFRATLTNHAPVAPTGMGTVQTLSITAGQTATYQFNAPAGRVVYLDSLNTSFQNLRVEIRDPNGVSLFNINDVSDVGPLTLSAAGTYSVVVSGGTPTQAGSYRFRVMDLSSAPALSLDTLTEGTLPPFEALVYRFTSTVGDEYVYNGLDADFDDVVAIVALQSDTRVAQLNSDSDTRIGPINEAGTGYVVLQNNLNATPNFRFKLLETGAAPTLTVGDLVTGTFPIGTEIVQYQFEGVAGQKLLYDGLDGDADNVSATLLAPGNLQSFGLNADFQTDPTVLTQSGTYTLVIAGNTTASADYRFRLLDVSAPPAFAIGDTVTGNVGASGREVSFYTFEGTAGQQIFYDALDADFDGVFVSIRDPFNNEVRGANADVDSGVLPLTVTGTYAAYVYGSTPNADFAFVLRDLAAATPLTLGAEVTGQTSPGRDTVVYAFDAVAGETLYFNGLDNDNDPTQIFIQNEKFQTVLQRNSSSEDGLFTANSTGRYYVFMVGRTSAPEDYRFSISDVSSAPELDFGVVTAGTLPSGTEHVAYRFDGAAGQRIYFDGLDGDFDQVNARVISPAGVTYRTMNADDNSAVFSLGETGVHYLVIEGNAAAGADYRFQLHNVDAAPVLTYGVDIAATIDPARAVQMYRVTGVPGNAITFDSLSTAPGTANWSLVDPANRQLIGGDQTSDFTSTLLYQGDYVLIVSGNIATPVNYSFRATSATLPTAPLSGFGVNQTAELEIGESATFDFTAPIGSLLYLDVLKSTFEVPEHTITLNQGETYLVRDALGSNDLTGTVVTATKPIAAYGSHLCAFVPDFTGFCDNLVEQLPSTDAWGREFVTVPLATRLNGDTFRFLAQTDNTEVRVNGTLVATIDRGEFHEMVLKVASEVSANHPILVGQYSNGSTFDGVTSDPFMVYLPPYEQYLSNYTVTTPATGFPINYVNVVASAADVGIIELDGAPIPANLYTAIGASGFFGAQVAVQLGSHTFAGPSPFGLTVYGYSNFDSYGYVGGQSLAPVAAAASLSLTVQQPVVPLGAEAIVQATVRDDNGQPLAGVRVDFAVAGANPQTAFAFTDDTGIATLRYVGSVEGLDTIDATVSNLIDTATVTWGAPTSGPSITILTPDPGAEIAAGTTIAVAGFAEADLPFASVIYVTVNGQPVEALDAAGNFFVRLAVLPGDNVYEFEVTDSLDQTARTTLTLKGVQRAVGDVDFDLLSNVSASFAPQYARTSLADEDTLFADIAIRNDGQYPADAPLFVAITNLSDPSVRVLDADGYTPAGEPYYDFTGLVTGGTLAPSGETGYLAASFFAPGRTQFTYDLKFFGKLNTAPQFATAPIVDGLAGRGYRYEAFASDPDVDAVTFSLPVAPEGMTIDPATGLVEWLPETGDLGVHEVIVLADDGRGGTTEQRYLITIVTPPPNRPPVFSTLPVVAAEAEAAYRYDADASDADGDALLFALTSAPDGMTINDATGEILWTPLPSQVGDFEVVVQVIDGAGGVATQRYIVCVEPSSSNHAPVITSAAKLFATGNYEYAVRALDANGDVLSFALDQAPTGMGIDPSTGLITWGSTPADAGPHDVVVRVSDGRGGSDTQVFTLTVVDNDAPIVTSAPVTAATVGVLYVYDVNATDSDVLTYSLLLAPSGMTIDATTGAIQWTPDATHFAQERVVVAVDDGRGGVAEQSFVIAVTDGMSLTDNVAPRFITSAPLEGAARQLYRYDAVAVDPNDDPVTFDLTLAPEGMAIDSATGTIVWTPRTSQTGPQNVVVRARDNQGGVTQQAFTIQVAGANFSPVFITEAGAQAVVGLPFAYLIAAQDANGDALEFTLDDAPAGATLGEVFGLPNRAILIWTPSGPGTESFTIEVSDGKGGVTRQQFVVTAVDTATNHDPEVTSSPRTTIPFGRSWFYRPAAVDEDHDQLTFHLDQSPSGMTIDPTTGQLIWTPAESQLGVSQVTLRVVDNRGGEFTQAFEMDVTSSESNGAPSIVSVPLTSAVVADSLFQYQPRAIDPDNDPLVWSLLESPDGVSIDPVTGAIRWTPAMDQLGAHTIVIQAADPFAASTTQRVSLVVTCVNQPPAILSRPDTTANADARYIYGIRAVDPESAALTYSLADAPNGMTIDGDTGVIRWTPSVAQLGPANVRVLVTDASGATAEQAFAIDVTQVIPDLAPIFRSRAAFRATVGSPYEYQAQAIDPEGTAVTYSLLTAPAGMAIDPNTGLIAWLPSAAQAGAHVVIVAADDADGNRGQQRYALLARVNQAPEITSEAPLTISAGAVYQYDVLVDDPENDPITYSLLEAPTGMTIDALGRITWTTALANLSEHTVTVQAADAHGLVDTQSFTLTVAPDTIAPRLSVTLSTPRVAIGSPVVITVQASDDVGIASLTLTINGEPVTLSEQGTAIYTPTAPGQLNIVATATDAAGNVGQTNALLRAFDPADTDGPTVEIASPSNGELVTRLTDIVGTASDANLLGYRVEYARADLVDVNDPTADDPDWNLIIESSTSVVNGTLGTFDPTLLMNDTYVVRVIAEDASGNLAARTVTLGVDGDLKLGEFRLMFVDLAVQVAGIPISVTRTYDTRQATDGGDFGFGWTMELQNGKIRESVPVSDLELQGLFFGANPFKFGTRVVLTGPDGSRRGYTFEPTPQFSWFGGGYWLPAFRPDPGVYDTLEVDATPLQLRPDGTFGYQLLGYPYNPSVYRMTTRQKTVYEYDQFAGLTKVTDRNGNTLTYSPDGVTSSSGKEVRFERDSFGRIVRILDPEGQAIQYVYDAHGDLVEVIDRAGESTKYEYDSARAHILAKEIDHAGRETLTAQYDGAGRLIGIANATGNGSQAVGDASAQTELLTDPEGHETFASYDNRGNLLESRDPAGGVWTYSYDANDNLTVATDPNGATITREYDDRGNVTKMIDQSGNVFLSEYNEFNQVSKLTDPLGRVVSYEYDDRGNVVAIINALGERSELEVDDQGRILSETDVEGRVTRFVYGDGAQPTEEIFPDGTRRHVEYGANGEVEREVDENGNATDYTYDAEGRLLRIVDALGRVTVMTYDGDDLATVTDPLGIVTRYERDDAKRIIRVVRNATVVTSTGEVGALDDAPESVTQYEYNDNNQVIAEISPIGGRTEYTYDDRALMETMTDALGNVTRFEYDGPGNLSKITDARGNATIYRYDFSNRLIEQEDALGRVQKYEYDALGNQTLYTDQLGRSSTFFYDALNRLVKAIDPLGAVQQKAYDSHGNTISYVNASGEESRAEYDDRQRLEKLIDALGQETNFAYDNAGNRKTATDPRGEVTTYTYDAANRVISTLDPLLGLETYDYDALDRMETLTDAIGRVERWTYNELGHIVEHVDAAGSVTRFTSDLAGNRLTLVDALGQTTSYVRDLLGRVEQEINPLGKIALSGYDEVGNLVQYTDRNGDVRQYDYDALNRTTLERWLTGSTTVREIVYGFNEVGDWTSVSDPDSQYAFTYNARGRLTQSDNAGTLDVPHVVLDYTRDLVGNILDVTSSIGVNTHSTYDAVNQLKNLRWDGPSVDASVNFTYDARGMVETVERFSDLTGTQSAGRSTLSYDAKGRLLGLEHRSAADAVISQYDYTYDLIGKMLTASDSLDSITYEYDLLGQLTSADHSSQPDEIFDYDALGNREGDDYEVTTGNRLAADEQFDYAYDDNGALILKTERATGAFTEFDYDHRGRLISIVQKDAGGAVLHTTTNRFDALDRRIAQTADGVTRYTVFDHERAFADFAADGSLETAYLHAPGTDNLLARANDDGLAWYLADQQGTTRDIVNSTGQLLDHIDYDSFGNVLAETNPAQGDRFKFTGREYDATSGLYYYRARYYDPQQGRFISQDPIGFGGGDANLYRYVNNSPNNASDPFGMSSIVDYTLNVTGTLGGRAGLINALATWGGDEPFTLRIAGNANGIRLGVDGGITLTHGGNSVGVGMSGGTVTATGSAQIPTPVGKITVTGSASSQLPTAQGNFTFYFQSTSTSPVFLARFSEAAFGMAAIELQLFAEYLVTPNSRGWIDTKIALGTLMAEAAALKNALGPDDCESPPNPWQFIQIGAPTLTGRQLRGGASNPGSTLQLQPVKNLISDPMPRPTPWPGVTTIDMHGGMDGLEGGLSASGLAMAIMSAGALGDVIHCNICYMGSTPNHALLQQITGSVISAPTGKGGVGGIREGAAIHQGDLVLLIP
jgi:RHS repeat-associated protein